MTPRGMTRPGHVLVLGGGFAGLSCATALAERGVRVTVVEARRGLGGRAGSFVDEPSGEVVDNGQHLFMACYRETRAFLRRIGTERLLKFQRHLTVDYVSHGFRSRLRCPPIPAPWHLLSGILTLKGPALGDRLALLRASPDLLRLRANGSGAGLSEVTVTQWLDRLGQTPGMRRWLWHPLAIATLNESPDIAPASLLASVLAEGFLTDAAGSALGVATVGLSDLYGGPSKEFIEKRGGLVRINTPVVAVTTSQGRVAAVRTRDGETLEADVFVSTLPPAALARLDTPEAPFAPVPALDRFTSSPILSVNLWLDRPPEQTAPFDFAGVVGGRIQWVFNKARILAGRASHLAVVISAARDLVARGNEELADMALQDLRAHLPGAREARLERAMVVRERTATFSATVATEKLRPGQRTAYSNMLLAGDWTERGLPATIETAARTGHRCAQMIHPA